MIVYHLTLNIMGILIYAILLFIWIRFFVPYFIIKKLNKLKKNK